MEDFATYLNENLYFFGALNSENICYLLSKNSKNYLEIGKKQLCIIPYKNPSLGSVCPSLYEVQGEKHFSFDLKENCLTKEIVLKSSTTKAAYLKKLIQLKQQIQEGNIYEINFCIEFLAEGVDLNPFLVYDKLNKITKAPYSSFLKIGNDYIISASPELFLRKEARMLYTKPIKGTAKRGNTKSEDEALKNNLFNSLKERTENVMAVDVARNDLSMIAKRGSVRVNKLYNIETYETVHQMVSTVSCEIKDGVSFENIISATFPMASMTGAPKISAMNLIDEFEDFDRKYYSGAMGIINENEDFELAVNIRSIFYNQQTKRLSIAVGSAITHLCEPEKEYEECLLKAKALLMVLNATIK